VRGVTAGLVFGAVLAGMPDAAMAHQAVVKERISLVKADPNLMRDEITITDHALTRPWTVTRDYRREHNAIWIETICSEDNRQVRIGRENYYINADDQLTPTRKGQPPPT